MCETCELKYLQKHSLRLSLKFTAKGCGSRLSMCACHKDVGADQNRAFLRDTALFWHPTYNLHAVDLGDALIFNIAAEEHLFFKVSSLAVTFLGNIDKIPVNLAQAHPTPRFFVCPICVSMTFNTSQKDVGSLHAICSLLFLFI